MFLPALARIALVPQQRPNTPRTITRVLSVRQPWCLWLVAGVKPVENRRWPLPAELVGRWTWIHASGRPMPRPDLDRLAEAVESELGHKAALEIVTGAGVSGAVLGAVRFAECVTFAQARRREDWPDLKDWCGGPWCWLTDAAWWMTTPFPCRGRLRLWTPPAGLVGHAAKEAGA